MKPKKIIAACTVIGSMILFTNCDKTSNPELDQLDSESTLATLDNLLTTLKQADTTDCNNLDDIVTTNEKMRRIIENIRSIEAFDGVVNAFDANKHQITFTVSEDHRFGVFSWRTKMNCMGNDIKNIALYKSNGKIVASSLYGKPMMFHKITSENQNDGKTVYLLNVENEHFNHIPKAYTISNGYLAESQIPIQKESYEGYAATELE